MDRPHEPRGPGPWHSPGPWQAQGEIEGDPIRIVDVDGETIIYPTINETICFRRPADKALVLAAPDLLVALKVLRAWCIPGMDWTDDVGQALLAQADEAIAGAKAIEEAR